MPTWQAASWLDGHRRRSILALVGVAHLAMALRLATAPAQAADPATAILHELLIPLPVRVGLWAVVGVALIVCHLYWEQVGWFLAMLMPIERIASYAWSGVMWLLPGWPPGAITSWWTALLWSAYAGVLFIVATWEERPWQPQSR